MKTNHRIHLCLAKDRIAKTGRKPKLDKAGIEARPLWKPMHKQPVFKNSPAYVNGTAEAIFKCGICLPSGPMVTDEDAKYIISKIKEAIQ